MRFRGTFDPLVQTFIGDSEHIYLNEPVYPAMLAELLDWVNTGRNTSPVTEAQRCEMRRPALAEDAAF